MPGCSSRKTAQPKRAHVRPTCSCFDARPRPVPLAASTTARIRLALIEGNRYGADFYCHDRDHATIDQGGP